MKIRFLFALVGLAIALPCRPLLNKQTRQILNCASSMWRLRKSLMTHGIATMHPL